ncbi:uncharacterized protein EI97DRAFT_122764 [Westerdykella ornata]|uniref:Uncharacterized protein n=1 Tax=Westerdykella ornata TaxID=318751 RepID=A0A6A6JZD1_WESOR|nr:uncharacterized protein EI97DRAFT_122764 [Westerdykella ornata]KAF2280419.1 hypothetical protein EI97DRAFT_122764 [Westerdykella ornata]
MLPSLACLHPHYGRRRAASGRTMGRDRLKGLMASAMVNWTSAVRNWTSIVLILGLSSGGTWYTVDAQKRGWSRNSRRGAS